MMLKIDYLIVMDSLGGFALSFERSWHNGRVESIHHTGVRESLQFAGPVDDLMDVNHVLRSTIAWRRRYRGLHADVVYLYLGASKGQPVCKLGGSDEP